MNVLTKMLHIILNVFILTRIIKQVFMIIFTKVFQVN